MNDAPIRVMLVDDQELIRTGFRLVLLAEPGIEVVAEASDGGEALAALEAAGGACDVVLMDVRMPGMNGIEATARIVAEHPDTRVLVLTTFDLDEYAVGAVRAGASGFLLKDARPAELIDAIRRVADGDAAMAPSVTKRLIAQLREGETGLGAAGTGETSVEAPSGFDAAAFDALTERELEVLRLIAAGRNNSEIGGELFLSESTVKTHVGRVLAKLQLRDRVHAVIYAKEHGL
ncbi:response regulator [Leucobacter ruminantium]|uniref:Response regulator transcription factor n=1 Tax=Leucobacter ruminantium TaxID=1289170 RepID=A0A939RXM2_9MICO|nr:response regulator transcription factor [Leucobacter ruminantium]MBO1806287.1 response regulator transcription factor [Leucobacter ruminantium]